MENYVRTAAELERKYNLSGTLSNIDSRIKETSASLVSTQNSISNFVTQVTEDIADLQSQIDGNITSWFYPGVPTLSNEPAVNWTTITEKDNHLGDLYYDQQTGYAYRFVVNSGVYSWLELTDSAATEALAIANDAYDIATDHKRRVFVTQPTPPYDVGDMWLYDSKMIKCCIVGREEGASFVSNDWIDSSYYTANEQATIAYNNALTQVATTYTAKADLYVGGDFITSKVKRDEVASILKNINYVQATDPSLTWLNADTQKSHVGDIWYDTSTYKAYSYDNSYQWVEIPTTGIRIFINQPTPPYNSGDIYLKEFTDSSTTPPTTYTKLYVCQVDKSSGSYEATDFTLQPTRVTTSELKQTADEINISVSNKVDSSDYSKAEIIARINDNTSQAMINADEISFSGHTFNLSTDNIEIDSDNFSVDDEGNMICHNATATNLSIDGGTIWLYGIGDEPIIEVDNMLTGDVTCLDGAAIYQIDENSDEFLRIDEGGIRFRDKYVTDTSILWHGALKMTANEQANLSERVSEQLHGIVLVWSAYSNNTYQNYNYRTFFIPKDHITYSGGGGYCCVLASSKFANIATKYVYINDTNIKGNADNNASGTASGTNIKYNNSIYCLRYVIGV